MWVTEAALAFLIALRLTAGFPKHERDTQHILAETKARNIAARILGEFEIEKRRTIGPVTKDEKRSCKCQCRDRYRPGQWHCCSCTWTQKSCFPATVNVTLQNGRHILMEDLKIGDVVATVSDDGKTVHSEVLAFLHREPQTSGLYLTLTTSDGTEISLSPSHILFTSNRNTTNSIQASFAEEVNEGDYVFINEDGMKLVPKQVVGVTAQILEGIYVPLTSRGTLLVNGVLASCYASVSHDIAHAAMAPVRWFPRIFHDPNMEGVMPYVKLMKQIGIHILNDVHKSPKYRSKRSPEAQIHAASKDHYGSYTEVCSILHGLNSLIL